MRHIAFLIILLLAAQALANPASAVKVINRDEGGIGYGSAVVIDGGYAVTIEHVIAREGKLFIEFDDGTRYSAKLVYNPPRNQTDEAAVLKIIGGDALPFSVVARTPPRVGERVSTVGYPGGQRRMALSGRVTAVHDAFRDAGVSGDVAAYAIKTDIPIDSGHSGGPLWNDRGELVGLASRTTMIGGRGIAPSHWTGLQSIQAAVASLPVQSNPPVEINPDKPDLVVFTMTRCPPCESLKDDVKAGAYSQWNVLFVELDQDTRQWSVPWVYVGDAKELHPELDGKTLSYDYADATSKTRGQRMFMPTIWVRYTSHSYSGRSGLLGWLRGILAGIRDGLFGEPAPRPAPPQTPFGEPEPYGRSPESEVDGLKEELADVKALAEDAISRVRSLKDEGLVGKTKDLLAIKSDVSQLKEKVGGIRSHAEEIKEGFKNPLSWPGYLLGAYGWYRRRKGAA